jgi:hypothetical protein
VSTAKFQEQLFDFRGRSLIVDQSARVVEYSSDCSDDEPVDEDPVDDEPDDDEPLYIIPPIHDLII